MTLLPLPAPALSPRRLRAAGAGTRNALSSMLRLARLPMRRRGVRAPARIRG